MSNYMMVMGIWTAVTRGLLLELICDFVSRAIMYALAALASSWFTFGGSIAALIGGLVADAMSVMAKISQHISKLGQAMSQLGQRMGKVGEIIDDIGKALDRFGTGKKFDLNFSSLQKGMDLKFDQLGKSIWDDSSPTPGTAGPRSNYQLDNTHTIYNTMNDMFGSGNLPTSWANNAHAWNNVGNILTGYPMTGLKSLLGGGPGAIQVSGLGPVQSPPDHHRQRPGLHHPPRRRPQRQERPRTRTGPPGRPAAELPPELATTCAREPASS
jgi:hypothetical protein